jgi:hypothetical protein
MENRNMSDFLFINAPGAAVPTGTERVQTRGHSVRGRGAADYVYDPGVAANSATTFVAADGRGFRLAADQRITIDMFGAVPDDGGIYGVPGAADNYPAFQAAFAFLEANRTALTEDVAILPELHIPGLYYCGTQLELKQGAFSIIGEPGSRIRFPANSNGIIVHSRDTIGESTTTTNPKSGAGSVLRGLTLKGSGGTNPNKHGIRCRAICLIENCAVAEFSGDGIHIVADVTAGAGTPGLGNANQWALRNVTVNNNGRHGLYIAGGDSNAGLAVQVNALSNGRWGVLDESFLGNTHVGHHSDSNGIKGAGCTAYPNGSSSLVAYGGFHYSVALGQHAAASTTVPGTNEAVWVRTAPGGPTLQIPEWQSGAAYFSGGAYASTGLNGRHLFVGCYSEGSQGHVQFSPHTLAVGGFFGANLRGGAAAFADNYGLRSYTFRAGDPEGPNAQLGGGDAADGMVLKLADAAKASGGHALRYSAGSGDLVMRYANLDAWEPFRITGPNSTSPVGPHRFTVNALGLGWSSEARVFGMIDGQPGVGYARQGTRLYYCNPVAGGREGVVCVATGNPAVWKEFGSIQA